MRFIVAPQEKTTMKKPCNEYHTMCALCSEDPRFCDPIW